MADPVHDLINRARGRSGTLTLGGFVTVVQSLENWKTAEWHKRLSFILSGWVLLKSSHQWLKFNTVLDLAVRDEARRDPRNPPCSKPSMGRDRGW